MNLRNIWFVSAYFSSSQLNRVHLQIHLSSIIKRQRLILRPYLHTDKQRSHYFTFLHFMNQALQLNLSVYDYRWDSPVYTLEVKRLLFLPSSHPQPPLALSSLINPRLKSQAMWAVFVLQGHDKTSSFLLRILLFSQGQCPEKKKKVFYQASFL